MNILTLLTTFLPAIMQIGQIITQVWPQATPAVTTIATNVKPPSAHSNVVSLVQEVLNALQAAGVISFGQPLVADGNFGGRTFAAIKVLQAKVGFTVQEPLASLEYNMLSGLLNKL